MSTILRRFSKVSILMLIVFVLLISASVSFAATFSYSGTIASGAQFDNYTVYLEAGSSVVATLVCDFDGVSRPLDPVLSMFNSGLEMVAFNDDGFGLDDDPAGVDCDAFDSSRIFFTVFHSGDYIFQVNGFGSSTGPYTLTVNVTPRDNSNQFTDGRINPHNHAPVVVYCDDTIANIYSAAGVFLMNVTADEAAAAAPGAVIESAGGATLSKTADGRLSLLASLPDGKGYLFIWNGCPATASETYTIEGGVGILFQTRAY